MVPLKEDTSAPHKGAVLVTGASSSIGRSIALLLDRSAYRVFAGARRDEDAERLRQDGSERLTPLKLDVTVQGQIDEAVKRSQAAARQNPRLVIDLVLKVQTRPARKTNPA